MQKRREGKEAKEWKRSAEVQGASPHVWICQNDFTVLCMVNIP